MSSRSLLFCFAHPDDEAFLVAGIACRYGEQGVHLALATATLGEAGKCGNPPVCTREELPAVRERELRESARLLGLGDPILLGYHDRELANAPPAEIREKLVRVIRTERPQVIVTFDPNGSNLHPDHIAISQFTQAAIVAAADPTYGRINGYGPHRVAKLYYMADSQELADAYLSTIGDISMNIDGVERRARPWEDWAITTRIDTARYSRQVWQAAACHRSQLPDYDRLNQLPEEVFLKFWGCQTFYRAFSLVNGGRQVEHDLFEGLR